MMITLFTGCTKEELGDPIPYEIIFEGQTSYAEQAIIPEQYLLIKNETDWDNFIPEIERVDTYLAEDLRNLNFDFIENYLIVIIGKYYNYCCSEINVNGVFKENKNIVVKYSESGPGGFTAISQAYTLLTISKADAD